MPGRNCAFPQCGAAEYSKYAGTKFLQIPTRKNDFYTTWRKQLTDILLLYRQDVDGTLKERINKGNVYICSRHFKEDDFEILKTGKREIKLGALPTINLPKKACDSFKSIPKERRHINIVRDFPAKINGPVYSSYSSFITRITTLKLPNFTVEIKDNFVRATCVNAQHCIPKFEVVIDKILNFTCSLYGWSFPSDHIIYKKYNRSMKNVTLSNLLREIILLETCKGVDSIYKSSRVKQHIMPTSHNISSDGCYAYDIVYRDTNCYLVSEDSACDSCKKCVVQCQKYQQKQEQPVSSKAPLSKTSKIRLQSTVKSLRNDNKSLSNQVSLLKKKIKEQSISVSEDLNNDFEAILKNNEQTMSPFMKLFWQHQRDSIKKNRNAVRYHPMIIRFCLSLCAKSASAYDELTSSNILCLPSRRTLRDYRNVIKPAPGFNPQVIEELQKLTKHYKSYEKYVILSFDEIKIQQSLVFDKSTNKLIGFVELGDPSTNFSMFEDKNELATHVLVFYVRGIASSLKYALAYFGTSNLKAYQLMTLFWEAIAILELSCDLSVVATVSDGASMNRNLYRLHKDKNFSIDGITYKSSNYFSTKCQYVWFVADPPHLVKTARNCLAHSGMGTKYTRCMWNDGKYIIWSQICQVVNDDMKRGLKLLPKLSLQHISLTSYSVMNVRLAAQVLSESTSKVLLNYYPSTAHETAKYCMMIDKFFDCLNVRNQKEGLFKRKEFKKPYYAVDDERLIWLKNSFLQYLRSWKNSIESRPGKFSSTDKEKMFMSQQTYEGFQINVYSFCEIIPFLLRSGMPYVLTVRFNQDCLEEYFGHQRSLGRRNDNPSLYQFGYNSNVLRLQRSVTQITGNTEGRHRGKKNKSWSSVDETLLPKRKKSK